MDCGGGEESPDYCARTGEKLRGLSGQDSNKIRKCPASRRALPHSYAGTSAKAQGLGKRALSNEYLRCGSEDTHSIMLAFPGLALWRKFPRKNGEVLGDSPGIFVFC